MNRPTVYPKKLSSKSFRTIAEKLRKNMFVNRMSWSEFVVMQISIESHFSLIGSVREIV